VGHKISYPSSRDVNWPLSLGVCYYEALLLAQLNRVGYNLSSNVNALILILDLKLSNIVSDRA
jgi:hypothetical protein